MSDETLENAVGEHLKVLNAFRALTAAIERSGHDVSPCLICQELTVCIPYGLAICRVCSEKAAKVAGRDWYFEDDLPSDYDYQANFDRSRVIDGVRMFPSIPKTPKEG